MLLLSINQGFTLYKHTIERKRWTHFRQSSRGKLVRCSTVSRKIDSGKRVEWLGDDWN